MYLHHGKVIFCIKLFKQIKRNYLLKAFKFSVRISKKFVNWKDFRLRSMRNDPKYNFKTVSKFTVSELLIWCVLKLWYSEIICNFRLLSIKVFGYAVYNENGLFIVKLFFYSIAYRNFDGWYLDNRFIILTEIVGYNHNY